MQLARRGERLVDIGAETTWPGRENLIIRKTWSPFLFTGAFSSTRSDIEEIRFI